MGLKSWTESEVRAIARQFVEGRQKNLQARGEYFRALVETAQAELGGESGKDGQLAALRAAHHRFYPVVQKAIATDEILIEAGFARKDVALERNRRLNFARSSYGTIRSWLRAEGHDLMKLNAKTVTKSQLENDSPLRRKHPLTSKRINARAKKYLGTLLDFTKEIAKVDQAQAVMVVEKALERFIQLSAQLRGGERKTTTDAKVAVLEMRPLKIGKDVFWPAEQRIAK